MRMIPISTHIHTSVGNAQGVCIKTKSRLVIKGFNELAGVSYNYKTTSPTSSVSYVKNIITVLHEKWLTGLPSIKHVSKRSRKKIGTTNQTKYLSPTYKYYIDRPKTYYIPIVRRWHIIRTIHANLAGRGGFRPILIELID